MGNNPASVSALSAQPLSFLYSLAERERVGVAVTLSLIAHLLLIITLLTNHHRNPDTRPIRVSLIKLNAAPQEISPKPPEPPPTAANRIVSPSMATNTLQVKPESFLSDRDAATDTQKVKRGIEGDESGKHQTTVKVKQLDVDSADSTQSSALRAGQTKQTNSKLSQTHTERNKDLPPLLHLDSDTVASKFGTIPLNAERNSRTGGQETKDDQTNDLQHVAKLENYEPFARRAVPSALGSLKGSSDYLPEIPDGDITLLNTKADRHAVFVRRVALQVFGSLRKSSWNQLPYSQIRLINDFAAVEGIISPTGKLLDTKLLSSSGNRYFDRVLLNAVKEATSDQNPPVSATAADGNIHFVFRSRTWGRRVGEDRVEQRWLLLGTGLL